MIVFTLFISSQAAARDDFQYWSQYSFKLYDGKKFDWITFGEFRVKEDAHKVGLYYISERLVFDLWEHLSLGFNYTYLNTRKTSSGINDDYKFQHRLEGEVNPHWDLTDWLKLHIRNRAEFRWIEDNGSYNTRLRQRWTFTVPVKSAGFLKSLYFGNEFIYNIAEHEYNENRTVPLGAQFTINDKTSFSLFYMIQSQKGTNDWSSNQILGTLVSVKF